MAPREIITLDFTEYDTIDALKMLINLCESNRVAGMVFAVAMKHSKPPQLFGMTGRPASNTVEAVGLVGLLHTQISQEHLSKTNGHGRP